MTKDEALKLALETLECWQRNEDCNEPMSKILEAIKEALAQPEQSPMHYYRADTEGNLERIDIHSAQPESVQPMHSEIMKMYEDYFDKCFRETSEPVPENFMDALRFDVAKREWVGLTDEEQKTIADLASANEWHDFDVMEATETKLKEKNT